MSAFAMRRSTILADARAGGLSHLPHLTEVVTSVDDPRVTRVLAVVRVGSAAPDVEAMLADAKTVEDLDGIYRGMLGKNEVPSYIGRDYWVGRRLTGGGHTLDVLVAPDYGAVVGSDGKPFRIGKSSQRLAQEYADAFDAILPSQKLLRELEGSADVKIGFIPVQKGGGADDSVEAVVTANDKAVAALEKAGASDDDGQLKIGYRKSYVSRPNMNGDYIAIYGGRWSAAGGLVQPTSGKAHTEPNAGNSWSYSDYSHALTLVSRKAKLDGEDVDLRTDVFGSTDPAIYGLVSDEGRFDPVFPNVGESSAARFAVGGGEGGGDEPGGEVTGGVDVAVTSAPKGAIAGGAGASTSGPSAAGAGISGSLDAVKRRFTGLSTGGKVGVIALVVLTSGGIAWAIL